MSDIPKGALSALEVDAMLNAVRQGDFNALSDLLRAMFNSRTDVISQAAAAHIANPSGGATTDAEARTAINAILVVLENAGLTATS